MTRLAAAALLAVTLLASACATTRYAADPALREAAHREAAALLQHVRVWDDPALADYLAGLGRRLSGATLRFHVLRDPSLALFSLPDGQVFVHTGLLAATENEAQLAALLGHEIAHVLNRDALEAGEPRRVRPRLDAGAATSPTAAAIFSLGLPLTARAALRGYGGRREDAADVVGLASLVRGGWDPKEASAIYLRLAAQAPEGGAREVFFFGDRERLGDRIETARVQVATRFAAAAAATDRVTTSAQYERLLLPVVRENADEDIRQGRFELARRQLDRVGAATPDDPRLHLQYGDLDRLAAQRAPSGAGRDAGRARARAAYERAIQVDPGLAEAHRQLGLLWHELGDDARARAELERYLALAPGAADAARIAEYVRELAR